MNIIFKRLNHLDLDYALNFVYNVYITTIKDEDTIEGQKAFYDEYINNVTLKNKFLNNEAIMIAAIDVNKLVGIGSIDKSGFIDYLFVNRCYHGLHIGTKLLDELIKYAKTLAIEEIKLESSISNVDFYLKYGFKSHKEELKNNIRIIPMNLTLY